MAADDPGRIGGGPGHNGWKGMRVEVGWFERNEAESRYIKIKRGGRSR